jgi:hypothetical protein
LARWLGSCRWRRLWLESDGLRESIVMIVGLLSALASDRWFRPYLRSLASMARFSLSTDFDASRARKLCGLDVALVERWWGSVLLRRLPQSLGRLVMYARHSDHIEFVDQYMTK